MALSFVMPGLDPGIHLSASRCRRAYRVLRYLRHRQVSGGNVDCRVKPGNDDRRDEADRRLTLWPGLGFELGILYVSHHVSLALFPGPP